MDGDQGAASGCWLDLRAPGGRLLARYDPGRGLLEVRRGGDAVLFDLRAPDPASPKVAGLAGGVTELRENSGNG